MSSPFTGPGIILSFFKENPSSTISPDILEKWFADEFAPALLSTGAISSASLYKSKDPNSSKQNLLVYKVSDLSVVAAGALQKIDRTSKTGLFEGSVDEHVEMETGVFGGDEVFEVKAQGNAKDPEPVIMLAQMQPSTPSTATDLDKWYREEHNAQMSKEPGYLRTSRYRLLVQSHNTGRSTESEVKLEYLAIHAFGEGNTLGTQVEPLDPMTEWTKKVMADCTGIEAGIWERVRVFH